jgi:hypothetical protein
VGRVSQQRRARIHPGELSGRPNTHQRVPVVTLQDFVARYPATGPRRAAANNDELRELGSGDGVQLLTGTPAQGQTGLPDEEQARHLWVVRVSGQVDLPYILERAPNVKPRLTSGVAKHTNLTGGRHASCGGELWIDASTSRLYVNGCSGRHGPLSREQLEDACEVFRGLGFDVVSYGWDDETQRPYCQYYR